MAKSCKKGYYYCNTSKKCKKIPKGYHVMSTGYLMRDNEHQDEKETEGKKKKWEWEWKSLKWQWQREWLLF